MKNKFIPEGTRDLTYDECRVKGEIVGDLKELFAQWGYEEIITPTIEFYKTFNDDTQSLREEEMYKFFDSRGRILVLRPDMTIPIARVVGSRMKDSTLPIRFSYSANVFRVHESLGGKRNEYTDCGIELVGLDKSESDLEVIVTAIEALKKLNVDEFKLEIGNINLFNSAIEELEISDNDKSKLAELINKKSLKELEEFLENLEMDNKYKEFFAKLPWMFGEGNILKKYKSLCFNKGMVEGIEYLQSINSKLETLGYGDYVGFDLGMVPRLNYYTGIIFRGYISGIGNTVLSGGRYDKLVKNFGQDLKAIGFSINVDLVASLKCENVSSSKLAKYLIKYNIEDEVQAIKKSIELRQENKIVELIPCNNEIEMEVKEEYGD